MSDVPAPRRACYGLRPGAPCPAYDDGTWPEGCQCMNLKHYTGSLTWATAGIFFAIAALILLAFGLIINVAYGADNTKPCLTKEQARTKYPKEWIYWHGSNHCWDNVRGTANTANKPDNTVQIIRAPKPNRATKADKSLPIDASGNATTRRVEKPIAQGPVVYYPELMGGGGTSSDMLHPYDATQWQPITDFDKDPPPFNEWLRASPLVNK